MQSIKVLSTASDKMPSLGLLLRHWKIYAKVIQCAVRIKYQVHRWLTIIQSMKWIGFKQQQTGEPFSVSSFPHSRDLHIGLQPPHRAKTRTKHFVHCHIPELKNYTKFERLSTKQITDSIHLEFLCFWHPWDHKIRSCHQTWQECVSSVDILCYW